jgi:hypothetical protein
MRLVRAFALLDFASRGDRACIHYLRPILLRQDICTLVRNQEPHLFPKQ